MRRLLKLRFHRFFRLSSDADSSDDSGDSSELELLSAEARLGTITLGTRLELWLEYRLILKVFYRFKGNKTNFAAEYQNMAQPAGQASASAYESRRKKGSLMFFKTELLKAVITDVNLALT